MGLGSAVPADLTEEELEFPMAALALAREGRTDELADRVARGVPANLTCRIGDSLLILAAYHDHSRTVGMLLEHGADPNGVNDLVRRPWAQRSFDAALNRYSCCWIGGLTRSPGDDRQ